jgi:hypothetical protein
MARLSNIYGTQPIATAQRRGGGGGGGGGNNRPNRPRTPGGGGGAGGGPHTLPQTGLYQGDQGEAAANQNPEQFIRDLLARAGMMDQTGTDYADWKNTTLVSNLLSQYNSALAGNQTLSPVEWAQQQYGAAFGAAGHQGRHHTRPDTPFSAGTLGDAGTTLNDQYTDYQSNTDPLTYLTTKGQAGGALMQGGIGGNSDFTDYYTRTFIPAIQAQLETARNTGYSAPGSGAGGGGYATGVPGLGRGGGPGGALSHGTGGGTFGPNHNLSLDDFVQGRDLTNEARMGYLFRGNNQRLPGPISLAGRYSWWG